MRSVNRVFIFARQKRLRLLPQPWKCTSGLTIKTSSQKVQCLSFSYAEIGVGVALQVGRMLPTRGSFRGGCWQWIHRGLQDACPFSGVHRQWHGVPSRLELSLAPCRMTHILLYFVSWQRPPEGPSLRAPVRSFNKFLGVSIWLINETLQGGVSAQDFISFK